jgi:hypothetical protein
VKIVTCSSLLGKAKRKGTANSRETHQIRRLYPAYWITGMGNGRPICQQKSLRVMKHFPTFNVFIYEEKIS